MSKSILEDTITKLESHIRASGPVSGRSCIDYVLKQVRHVDADDQAERMTGRALARLVSDGRAAVGGDGCYYLATAPKTRTCGHCGSAYPTDRSCGCFDNGCE